LYACTPARRDVLTLAVRSPWSRCLACGVRAACRRIRRGSRRAVQQLGGAEAAAACAAKCHAVAVGWSALVGLVFGTDYSAISPSSGSSRACAAAPGDGCGSDCPLSTGPGGGGGGLCGCGIPFGGGPTGRGGTACLTGRCGWKGGCPMAPAAIGPWCGPGGCMRGGKPGAGGRHLGEPDGGIMAFTGGICCCCICCCCQGIGWL